MMAAQPYPSGAQYPVSMSPTVDTHPRNNLYRAGPPGPAPMPAHPQYATYPAPAYGHSNGMYRSPIPEQLNTFGLLTPPTATPSQFGSPLIPSGGYTPIPPGTPSHHWGTLNALALSPMGQVDPTLPYSYPQASPIIGQDPTCAAPGEVFSSVPLRHMHSDALGFHHPVYPSPHQAMFRPGPGLGVKTGPHGHLILGADGQPTTEIKKRSRTAQACERCRIRKARCFGGNPCNRCTKRRFVCEFSTAVRQRGPNKPQLNANVNGAAAGAGPASAPATTTLTPLATAKPPGSADSTCPSGSSSGGPASPSKRRHSLPEGPSQTYIPHAPTKSYSTDVPRLDAVNEEGMNFTVVPHLPTSSAEYLAPPSSAGGVYPTTPTVGTTTPGSGPASAGAERSPMFAYTPEMDSAPPTGGSSIDYPYTPISPATTFSPPLTMTPTVNAHNGVNYFASQQDQNAAPGTYV